MKKDKYGVKIKVGDFVLLDTMQGAEYPNMNSGQMVQIKKIGSILSLSGSLTSMVFTNLTFLTIVFFISSFF